MQQHIVLPNEFTFNFKNDSTLYYAKYIEECRFFQVTYYDCGHEYTDIYRPEVLDSHVYSGSIYNIKAIVSASTVAPKQRQISINVNAAYTAAKFEVENNPYSKHKDLQEVLDKINDAVYNVCQKAKDEWKYTFIGTGCWTVAFHPEDECFGVIDVTVDPSITAQRYYVNIGEYLEQA